MNRRKLYKTIPIVLFIFVVTFSIYNITNKKNPSNLFKKNIKIVCATKICINKNDVLECIGVQEQKISHLTIEKNIGDKLKTSSIVLTLTNIKCGGEQ